MNDPKDLPKPSALLETVLTELALVTQDIEAVRNELIELNELPRHRSLM